MQHDKPDVAQTEGMPASAGLGIPNGGLQVVAPSQKIYDLIIENLKSPSTANYEFADQSLLGDLFSGRWVALPYTYNALKTLRDCHQPIWRDNEVKNVHYILDKPWDHKSQDEQHFTHDWWHDINADRLAAEEKQGVADGF